MLFDVVIGHLHWVMLIFLKHWFSTSVIMLFGIIIGHSISINAVCPNHGLFTYVNAM